MFEQLIIDVYNLRQNNRGISAIIYSPLSTVGFYEIPDIYEYVGLSRVDMLYIEIAGENTNIYRDKFEGYKIDEENRQIHINFVNNKEKIMTY